jgi:hypothetical protein
MTVENATPHPGAFGELVPFSGEAQPALLVHLAYGLLRETAAFFRPALETIGFRLRHDTSSTLIQPPRTRTRSIGVLRSGSRRQTLGGGQNKTASTSSSLVELDDHAFTAAE